MTRSCAIAALAALFLSLAPVVALAQGQAAVEQQIRDAEKNWGAAVMAGDQAALGRILGNDLIYAHSSGVIETKQEYLGKLKTGDQKYASIDHQSVTVRPYGDVAIAHIKTRMTGSTKGVPFDNQLMLLHVWRKQGGNWQLVAHQSTRLNP
jgi:ketosteroid isomerase-like protein